MIATATKAIPAYRKKRHYNTTGFKYFCFGVNYNNCPETYEYFFKASSAEDVSKATGVDPEYINVCTIADISSAIRRRKHIDTVINGRLVETD